MQRLKRAAVQPRVRIGFLGLIAATWVLSVVGGLSPAVTMKPLLMSLLMAAVALL